MLFTFTHVLIKTIYLLLPAAAVLGVVRHHRRFRGGVGAVIGAFVAGFAISVVLNLLYAKGVRGRPTEAQVAIGTYFGAGMFLLLRLFDAGVRAGLRRLLWLHRDDSLVLRRSRVLAGAVARAAILFAIALPYVMA